MQGYESYRYDQVNHTQCYGTASSDCLRSDDSQVKCADAKYFKFGGCDTLIDTQDVTTKTCTNTAAGCNG